MQQRCLDVDWWQRLFCIDQLIDAWAIGQELKQRAGTGKQDATTAFLYQRRAANKLQRVTNPLLWVQEDRSPFQRRTVPARLAVTRARYILELPAPFIGGPIGLQTPL